jgi:hypothetical protein
VAMPGCKAADRDSIGAANSAVANQTLSRRSGTGTTYGNVLDKSRFGTGSTQRNQRRKNASTKRLFRNNLHGVILGELLAGTYAEFLVKLVPDGDIILSFPQYEMGWDCFF